MILAMNFSLHDLPHVPTVRPKMSSTNRKESSAGSESSSDENMPLYEKPQSADVQLNTIPPPNATSTEIREYLASVLKTKHGLSHDQVQRLVARWTVGRGYELRSYTAQMYLDIFGRDVGWVLYRDIQLEIFRTRRKTFWESRGICEFAHNCSWTIEYS